MALTSTMIPAATTAVTPTTATSGAAGGAGETAGGFATSLDALLSSVESSAGEANAAVADMVAGGDVHTAMLALHRAEVAMQLTVQVRNKLVQAYQDLMRMPI